MVGMLGLATVAEVPRFGAVEDISAAAVVRVGALRL